MTDGPKLHRRHGFYVLVMVIGWVLPPIAVLLRFGFGTDFFLNILLTLCGYIPGHGHNFYLQNIRNNHNKKRTPAWATRAGLVKDPTTKRKAKTQWANRYDERTPTRADGYQDDDEDIANNTNTHTKQPPGQLIEQNLLEPESFIHESSSSQHSASIDNSHHSNLIKNHHASFTNSTSSTSPTRTRNSVLFNSKKSNPNTSIYEDSKNDNNKKNKKNGTNNRRKKFDPLTTDLDTSKDHDDPYFIRRASTIHFSSSASKDNNRKSTIHSPTSVKSFPAKLGFGSKHSSSQKDREQEVNILGIKSRNYEENESRRSSSFTSHTQSNPFNSQHDNEDDGLNHQF